MRKSRVNTMISGHPSRPSPATRKRWSRLVGISAADVAALSVDGGNDGVADVPTHELGALVDQLGRARADRWTRMPGELDTRARPAVLADLAARWSRVAGGALRLAIAAELDARDALPPAELHDARQLTIDDVEAQRAATARLTSMIAADQAHATAAAADVDAGVGEDGYCSECGEAVFVGDRKCTRCGQAMWRYSPPPPSRPIALRRGTCDVCGATGLCGVTDTYTHCLVCEARDDVG